MPGTPNGATGALTIVHAIQWFELGGGESVALQLASHQRAAGHRVAVIALAASGPLAERFARAGVDYRVVPKRAGLDWTLPPRLLAELHTLRPNVVHTHDPQSLVYAAPAAKLLGARVVHTKHGETIETTRRMLLRRVASLCTDRFVAVSESTAIGARSRREVDPRRIRVVVNGVDTDRFRPDSSARCAIRRALGVPQSAFLVGTVGRHEPEKDHALLIRALAPLLRDDTHLVLAGTGSLFPELRRLAQTQGSAPHIHLLGARDDVPSVLAALDLFVLSSRTEGLPLALLEAMSSGLAVVATAVGGVPSVVRHGTAGLLVPPDTEAPLRDAVAALRGDRSRIDALGRQAREVVIEHHSLHAMAEAYLQLYRGS